MTLTRTWKIAIASAVILIIVGSVIWVLVWRARNIAPDVVVVPPSSPAVVTATDGKVPEKNEIVSEPTPSETLFASQRGNRLIEPSPDIVYDVEQEMTAKQKLEWGYPADWTIKYKWVRPDPNEISRAAILLITQIPDLPPDADIDGINDAQETTYGTDPRKADTDGDGLNDGFEVAQGTDPTKMDSDGDGSPDVRNPKKK